MVYLVNSIVGDVEIRHPLAWQPKHGTQISDIDACFAFQRKGP